MHCDLEIIMRLSGLALALFLITPAFADGAAPGQDLIGTSWTVRTLAGAPVAENVETTLEVRADGIGGKGGCNSYGGGFETLPGGIAFTQVFSTMMACPEPAMTQEQDWFQALEKTGQYRLEGDTLTLTDAAGNELATLARTGAAD